MHRAFTSGRSAPSVVLTGAGTHHSIDRGPISMVCWLSLLLAILTLAGASAGCGEQQEEIDSEDGVHDAETERRKAGRRERHKNGPERATSSAESSAGSRAIPGFAGLAHGLQGQVGATIGAPASDKIASGGNLTSGPAWSTIKLPIAARVLQDAGGPRGLTPAQRSQTEAAITASSNAAAKQLFDGLAERYGGLSGAAAAVTEVLREAQDATTEVSTQGRDGFSPYGQTKWSLRAQHQFMAGLAGGCIGSPASRRYLLRLMGQVTSDRWGLGSAGVPARWKGGWGPGTDGRYLVRQLGTVEVDGKDVVITIAAQPANGQFAAGQAMATRVARWVVQRADRLVRSPEGC